MTPKELQELKEKAVAVKKEITHLEAYAKTVEAKNIELDKTNKDLVAAQEVENKKLVEIKAEQTTISGKIKVDNQEIIELKKVIDEKKAAKGTAIKELDKINEQVEVAKKSKAELDKYLTTASETAEREIAGRKAVLSKVINEIKEKVNQLV